MSADPQPDRRGVFDEAIDGDGMEPWERCGCAACQATMAVLYGDPAEIAALDEQGQAR